MVHTAQGAEELQAVLDSIYERNGDLFAVDHGAIPDLWVVIESERGQPGVVRDPE